ncbi:MAG: tRNA (5-methylaminomethyl-2-thiouridine)(34)-methyltransferase MnmD [Bacteroidetes bacterium]|nr:tRNA (5-methylaminomethyl-2-thiouridine)(34)-methyltransferase MnmD [Bacteroidota bacterium]
MHTQIVDTQDGSHTLFVPELEEHYHSVHGAVNESMYVFIEAGLNYCSRDSDLDILEMGFGTGLNAFLTLLQNMKTERKIRYRTIELFPLDFRKVQQLNYTSILGNEDLFAFLHKCGWDREIEINEKFILHKIHTDFAAWTPVHFYDLIYFDAFAPDVQPELWTSGTFTKLFDSLNPGGVFTTYSAKGEVRRGLEAAGFTLERLPGPPGKREMLRGIKIC